MYKLKISNSVDLITSKEDELDFLKTDLFDDYSEIKKESKSFLFYKNHLFETLLNLSNYKPEYSLVEKIDSFLKLNSKNIENLDP